MTNPANTASFIGRLAADPVLFPNEDGSKKVAFSLYVDNNFRNRDGSVSSNKIPLEAFLGQDVDVSKTEFASIHKGDLIAVAAEARTGKAYTDKKSGETVYPGLKLEVQRNSLRFLESKGVVGRRLSERVAAANQINESAAAPAVTEAPAPAAQAAPAAPAQVQDVNVPTFGDVPAFGQ